MRDELDSFWGKRLEQMKTEVGGHLESVLDDPLLQQLLGESCGESGIIAEMLRELAESPASS